MADVDKNKEKGQGEQAGEQAGAELGKKAGEAAGAAAAAECGIPPEIGQQLGAKYGEQMGKDVGGKLGKKFDDAGENDDNNADSKPDVSEYAAAIQAESGTSAEKSLKFAQDIMKQTQEIVPSIYTMTKSALNINPTPNMTALPDTKNMNSAPQNVEESAMTSPLNSKSSTPVPEIPSGPSSGPSPSMPM